VVCFLSEDTLVKVSPGIYRHFKGHIYRVIGTAKHSETLGEHIVYVSTTDPEDIWVRPANMFLDIIERDGHKFQRFEPVEENKYDSE
jgi:hypothetical protein